MVAGWEIRFVDYDDVERTLPAEFDQVFDEVGGEAYLTFSIPNINNFRNFVDNNNNAEVSAYFAGAFVFSGRFLSADLSAKKIKLTVYDAVMVALDQAEPFTGVYDEIPADTILSDITNGGSIVGVGECPVDPVTVIFYNANRLDCVYFLAEALAAEAYSKYGSEIDVGIKGNAEHEFDPDLRLSVSKRAIDYRKYANQVVIRG